MISPKKEYLIEIFLKRAKYDILFEHILNYRFTLLKDNYRHVSKENLEKIRKKYNYKEFYKRASPLIDKRFSVEEIEEINKFLSSPGGKKMMNNDFASKLSETMEEIMEDVGKKMISLNKGRNI